MFDKTFSAGLNYVIYFQHFLIFLQNMHLYLTCDIIVSKIKAENIIKFIPVDKIVIVLSWKFQKKI
jgi:hypothetical protein